MLLINVELIMDKVMLAIACITLKTNYEWILNILVFCMWIEYVQSFVENRIKFFHSFKSYMFYWKLTLYVENKSKTVVNVGFSKFTLLKYVII